MISRTVIAPSPARSGFWLIFSSFSFLSLSPRQPSKRGRKWLKGWRAEGAERAARLECRACVCAYSHSRAGPRGERKADDPNLDLSDDGTSLI